jgi:hypothetical protein
MAKIIGIGLYVSITVQLGMIMTVKFFNTPYLLYKGDLIREIFSNIQLSDSFKTIGIPKRERRTDMIWASYIQRSYKDPFHPFRWRYRAKP